MCLVSVVAFRRRRARRGCGGAPPQSSAVVRPLPPPLQAMEEPSRTSWRPPPQCFARASAGASASDRGVACAVAQQFCSEGVGILRLPGAKEGAYSCSCGPARTATTDGRDRRAARPNHPPWFMCARSTSKARASGDHHYRACVGSATARSCSSEASAASSGSSEGEGRADRHRHRRLCAPMVPSRHRRAQRHPPRALKQGQRRYSRRRMGNDVKRALMPRVRGPHTMFSIECVEAP